MEMDCFRNEMDEFIGFTWMFHLFLFKFHYSEYFVSFGQNRVIRSAKTERSAVPLFLCIISMWWSFIRFRSFFLVYYRHFPHFLTISRVCLRFISFSFITIFYAMARSVCTECRSLFHCYCVKFTNEASSLRNLTWNVL